MHGVRSEYLELRKDGARLARGRAERFFSRKILFGHAVRKFIKNIGLSDSGSLHAWGACGGSSILPSPTEKILQN